MGSPVWGKAHALGHAQGYADGRRSVLAELAAAANKAKAQKHANNLDMAASVVGSVVVQVIPVVVRAWKARREQKSAQAPTP